MAYKCDFCAKGSLSGQNIKHHRGVAGGQWKRKAQKTKKTNLPNLQTAWMVIDGKKSKKRLCTSCLRKHKRTKTI